MVALANMALTYLLHRRFLIESSNRCGRKFRDAQAVLTLEGKARKRLLNNTSISRHFLVVFSSPDEWECNLNLTYLSFKLQ